VNELVTWLRAQLDEDERVARAADAGRWLPEDKGITFEYRADDFHEGEAQARLVADSRANQYHIASWDPARVLAEVDAKRQMLDLADRLAADADDAAMGTHPRRRSRWRPRLGSSARRSPCPTPTSPGTGMSGVRRDEVGRSAGTDHERAGHTLRSCPPSKRSARP
jgi:hypothetical protein